ncbi:MAG: hypothetical protein ACLVH3_09535 [Blautia obeum]
MTTVVPVRDHAGGQLWNPSLQAEAFTAEISEKRSFFRKAGERAVRLSPQHEKSSIRFRLRVIFQNIRT